MSGSGGDLARATGRLIVGGYVAAHGAQKLFGWFGGRGLEGTATSFEKFGLVPARPMAAAAGAAELGGGLLTAAGVAHPVGPVTVAATMAVAAGAAHRGKGWFTSTGGPELPLANLACAVVLAGGGAGRWRLGPPAPAWVAATTRLVAVTAATTLLARTFTARPTGEADAHRR